MNKERRNFLRFVMISSGSILISSCTKGKDITQTATNAANWLEKTSDYLERKQKYLEATQNALDKQKNKITETVARTQIPLREDVTPTPDLISIDRNNERALELSHAGEKLDLLYPRFTSFWTVPWFAEDNQPKEATIALVYGKERPSGLVTSADKLRTYYEETDGIDEVISPYGVKIIKTKPESQRINLLETTVSNFPPIVDAKIIHYINPDTGIEISQKIEQTKEVDRLHKFLDGINWSEVPEDLGEWSSSKVLKFIGGILKSWNNFKKNP